jgi:UDP-glucose 4-epimerase
MSNNKIVITGGAGYIGTHTIIELLKENRFDLISIDNFSNSKSMSHDLVENITGVKIKNYAIDICDKTALEQVFEQEKNIVGIIHFAAFKSVPESVAFPERYYHNNIGSLLNILDVCKKYQIQNFIFSSSCSIYGNIDLLPVNEQTTITKAASPYAYTKQVGERIVEDYVHASSDLKAMNLRYFNPVGSHISGMIGELPLNKPNNLVPVITKTAMGIFPKMTVFGDQLPTRDGTCIRDYIHVSDIAQAHVKALLKLIDQTSTVQRLFTFNLGSGNGVSVLEAIHSFEKVSGQKLNYELGAPREGDVIAIYSDSSYANNELGWTCQYSLDQMMDSAWKWELYQKENNIQ